MTGELENDRCYFCGGRLESKLATVPFVMNGTVAVIRNVPAQVCVQCGEAIMSSPIAQNIEVMLKQVYQLKSEVSVLNYYEPLPAAP